MTQTEFTEWLYNLPGFRRQMRDLTLQSVLQQFAESSLRQRPILGDTDWSYLILCASILAQSEKGGHQTDALRIAQHCIVSNASTSVAKDAACIILDTLTNRSAIALAEKRHLVSAEIETRIPTPLRFDWLARSLRYSVSTSNNSSIHLNRFQRLFWDIAQKAEWLSISAPTSAGKSYVLLKWLEEFLRSSSAAIVAYVVPTRALIQQVEMDVSEHLLSSAVPETKVTCLPLPSEISRTGNTVFVVTQERLHLLLSASAAIGIDLLIVDEAHKVGDGARGVLLEQVIEATVRRKPTTRVIFASPMTANPEILLEDCPQGKAKEKILSELVTVNQNLIWASQVPHQPKKWKLELCLPDEILPLGSVELSFRPTPDSKRVPFLVHAIGDRTGGNLIYVNTAADAEKTARQLSDLLVTNGVPQDHAIEELRTLVRKTIHENYALVDVLANRVAFHYGNMPLLIRTEIERLFRENVIWYLVCTSTLMEGVNLPCKTIFLRGPRKGRDTPMNATDFWNLAGRAGRLGKEFQGNVICIDPNDRQQWKEPPPRNKELYSIRRASDTVFSEEQEFLDYIRQGAPITNDRPEFEYVFGHLASHFLSEGSISSAAVAKRMTTMMQSSLEQSLRAALDDLQTPAHIIERNPGISPLAMDKLLAYFRTYDKPVEELLPVLPESEDAVEAYNRLLCRFSKYLTGAFRNREFALAILVVQWMSGHSLARIIQARDRYYKKKEQPQRLPSLIRATMSDVETVARFLMPKYSSCYCDLLKWHLTRTNRESLAQSIPDLNLWLEFGASQTTQLSLLALGLSRTTAIAASELIANDALDPVGCLSWIKQQNLDSLDLPAAVLNELAKLSTRTTSP